MCAEHGNTGSNGWGRWACFPGLHSVGRAPTSHGSSTDLWEAGRQMLRPRVLEGTLPRSVPIGAAPADKTGESGNQFSGPVYISSLCP